jgi:hypothetical protein
MSSYSNHQLTLRSYINVSSLMNTLKALKKVQYVEEYDITNTTSQTFPLKEITMNHYRKRGVYPKPIVVTDDNYCLDGRHRIAYYRENNINICSAYIVPRSQIDKFIESV